MLHLWKAKTSCPRLLEEQYSTCCNASDPAHSSSGGASVTTHTVGQQQANVSQQSSSAETKPVVRRIENSEPTIFDLRERDDEVEGYGIRVVHFYIAGEDDDDNDDGDGGSDDDGPEIKEFEEIDIFRG